MRNFIRIMKEQWAPLGAWENLSSVLHGAPFLPGCSADRWDQSYWSMSEKVAQMWFASHPLLFQLQCQAGVCLLSSMSFRLISNLSRWPSQFLLSPLHSWEDWGPKRFLFCPYFSYHSVRILWETPLWLTEYLELQALYWNASRENERMCHLKFREGSGNE